MPFALIIIGVVLLVSVIRNTQGDLYSLLVHDFTGANNFIFWAFSILVIGSIGYIPKLKTLSNVFIALVILVLILTKGKPSAPGGGFFQQLITALKSTQTFVPKSASASTSNNLSNAFSFLGGGSSGTGTGPANPFPYLTGINQTAQPVSGPPLGGTGSSGGPTSYNPQPIPDLTLPPL